MTLLKKMIFPLALAGVILCIVFYPLKVKPDINGLWAVDSMVVNGQPVVFGSPISINNSRIDITNESIFTDNRKLLK